MHRAASVIALLLAMVGSSDGQTVAPDSVRIARLSALGRLWGIVKYFHPALAGGSGSWDVNTTIAIDAVRAARTTGDYSSAVGTLLASLRDPFTRVVPPTAPALATTPSPAISWRTTAADSTLIVTISEIGAQTEPVLRRALPDVRRAARIVFDLRGPRANGATDVSGVFASSGLDSLLPDSPVAAPAMKMRMHSGFPPETAQGSDEYWSGSYERPGSKFTAAHGARRRPIIFLVNSNSDIPRIAFALQSNGQAQLVVDGDTADLEAAAELYSFSLGEGIEATIRIGQLAGGVADTVVGHGSSGDAPLDAALFLARRGPRAPTSAAMAPRLGKTLALPSAPFPTTGYRVLAAYQWWNAIQYFYPYKSLLGESWDAVLPSSIALMESAQDSLAYALSVATMATHIHDSHGFVISPTMEGHYGLAYVAAHVQYIGGEPVVVAVAPDAATLASGLMVGDVILRVDGEDAATKRSRLAPYIPHSTPQSLDALVARGILSGPAGAARLTVRGAHDKIREILVPRTAAMAQYLESSRFGPVMKLLPGNIGYVDLSRLPVSMVDSMFTLFSHTVAIIFDDRGYPQGTAWSIAPRLTDRTQVPAARFDRPLVMSPDSSSWASYSFIQYLPVTSKPRYYGKTVMLVDERTISQAEHTGLFFEAANHTVFVGSPTVGANGDVTGVALAGDVNVYFTGQSVQHFDGRQLQRIGLQPDIVVRPTLTGIRSGRDEVLERALRYLAARPGPKHQ